VPSDPFDEVQLMEERASPVEILTGIRAHDQEAAMDAFALAADGSGKNSLPSPCIDSKEHPAYNEAGLKPDTGATLPISIGIRRGEGWLAALRALISHNRIQILVTPAMIAVLAVLCSAQSVTPARSGLLHYFEGNVSVDGAQVESREGRFPEIKEQRILCTAQGRAEVLLTPGVFLRVGENSAIRMLDQRLASTRVELLSGTISVESDDPEMSIKDPPVTLLYKDYAIQLVKHGLIEISSEPSQMKIYKGEAAVDITAAVGGNERVAVKEGRILSFSKPLNIQKFDTRIGDDLLLWARDRSQSLSAANMSSARSLSTNRPEDGNGLGSQFTSSSQGWAGGWYFNPYFNMYTFIPVGGTFVNLWGYGFFSPETISSYYIPSASVFGRSHRGASDSAAVSPLTLSSHPRRGFGDLPALESPSGNGPAMHSISSAPASTGFGSISGGHMSANRAGGGVHGR